MDSSSALLRPIIFPLVTSNAQTRGVLGNAVMLRYAFTFDYIHKLSAAFAAKRM